MLCCERDLLMLSGSGRRLSFFFFPSLSLRGGKNLQDHRN